MTQPKTQVRGDARGRLTLGAIAREKTYEVKENERGEIILTPVVSIPEREAWLYKNPAARELVERGIADARAGRIGLPQSFAEFAELDIDDE